MIVYYTSLKLWNTYAIIVQNPSPRAATENSSATQIKVDVQFELPRNLSSLHNARRKIIKYSTLLDQNNSVPEFSKCRMIQSVKIQVKLESSLKMNNIIWLPPLLKRYLHVGRQLQ